MDYDNFGGNDTRKAAESLKRQRAIAQMKRERRKKLLIRRTVILGDFPAGAGVQGDLRRQQR